MTRYYSRGFPTVNRLHAHFAATLIAVGASVGGCAVGCGIDFNESARRDVAAGLLNPGELKLEVAANNAGEGAIVLVRGEDRCAVRYKWLWLGVGGVYALDEASHAIAPSFPVIETAPQSWIQRAGVGPKFYEWIREVACRSPQDSA